MTFEKIFFTLLAFTFCAGCFRHQEAPERPVSADSLPAAIERSSDVQRVVLNGCALEEVPSELSTFPNLKIVYLRENSITNFTGLADVRGVEELDLSRNRLVTAPKELASLGLLRRLYLTECGLKAFPPVSGLSSLEYLNLDRNAIGKVPDDLPASLRWLRLNGNQITTLPESIGSLARLQRLYLEDNRLSTLPASLEKLSLLEDMDLSGNNLSSLPEAVVRLPKLRNLDLRGNVGLRKLPEGIGGMKALRTLVLVQCPLSAEERARVRAALPDCVINF